MNNEIAVAATTGRSLIRAEDPDSMVPDFMRPATGEAAAGTELLTQFVTPPRLKVIQNQRAEQYKSFSPGDVVLTPHQLVLAKRNEPFWFVPLLFYPEWCTLNPLEMKASLKMVRERSMDIRSPVAKKARDEKLRGADPCPENPQYKLRHVEFLSFIVMLIKPGFNSTPALMAFSRAEHRMGSNLAALIKNRQAPIYGCVFEGKVPDTERRNQLGAWYGIDVTNPTSEGCPPMFVPQADFEELKALHDKYKAAYAEGLIQADYGEDELAEDVAEEKKF